MSDHKKEMLFGILAALFLIFAIAAPIICKCTHHLMQL